MGTDETTSTIQINISEGTPNTTPPAGELLLDLDSTLGAITTVEASHAGEGEMGGEVNVELFTRPCSGASEDSPVPSDESYGNFGDAAVRRLFEDICTAVSQQTDAALYQGLTVGDETKAGTESAKAFAHYTAQAIAGFINNLEITIELQADLSAAAISTTVTTAGTAAAQTGTGIGDITSAIEASTFKVTLSTK